MSEPPPPRSFRRRGLGRGLEALLNPAIRPEGAEAALISVAPAEVGPNPLQPRRAFDEAELDTLGESIRLHGLLHPIVVQRDGDRYRLVAGERRLRAAQRAGVAAIPAILRPAAESDRQALEMALTENLLRTDLNPMEEAAAYARLADTFGLSHEAIGLRLGRSRPAVTNAIRLLALPAPVQEAVAEGKLTAGHARAILGLPDAAAQASLARDAIERSLSVRETEEAVHRRSATAGPAPRPSARAAARPLRPDDEALRRGFEAALGLPVRIARNPRTGGHVVIDFLDDSDLDALYRRLNGPPL
jgi:ParB family transcriptional regulator, chromosome partitioning protein